MRHVLKFQKLALETEPIQCNEVLASGISTVCPMLPGNTVFEME
jgi:hypothetical protein